MEILNKFIVDAKHNFIVCTPLPCMQCSTAINNLKQGLVLHHEIEYNLTGDPFNSEIVLTTIGQMYYYERYSNDVKQDGSGFPPDDIRTNDSLFGFDTSIHSWYSGYNPLRYSA